MYSPLIPENWSPPGSSVKFTLEVVLTEEKYNSTLKTKMMKFLAELIAENPEYVVSTNFSKQFIKR